MAIPDNHSSRGLFDEVRVYKKVLTQAEIQADMLDSDCEEPEPGNYCEATFVDGITAHGASGTINFNRRITLFDNPDEFLAASTINNVQPATCDPFGNCLVDPNGPTNELDFGDFQTTSSTVTYSARAANANEPYQCIIGELSQSNIDNNCSNSDSSEYQSVNVQQDRELTFSSNHSTYKIGTFSLSDRSTLILPVGDYWIDSWNLGNDTEIIIPASGEVRIFLGEANANHRFADRVLIDTAESGASLLIYSYSNVQFGNDNVINGLIYSAGDLSMNYRMILTGAASGNNVSILDDSKIYYTCGAPTPTIDHFLIEHDGTGLTCEAETVIVKACADSNCSSLVENSGATVTLNINGSPLPDSTFEIGPSGLSPYSFNFTTAGTATLSLEQTYECFNGSTDSCDIVFKDAELRFSNSINGTVSIPTQISGKRSDVGYDASNLFIEAIQTNPNSGACEAIVVENQYFEIAAECNNPSTCNDNVTINNTSITPSASGSQNYQSMNIGFDATGKADYVFYYPDAGSMTLHARYNIPIDGVPSGTYITGNSGSFVVRPFGFSVVADGNPQTPDSSNPVYQAAGEPFDLTISAHQWGSGQDVNPFDGEPDEGVDISGNGITDNFFGTADITPTLVAPSLLNGGVLGTLSETFFDNISSGQQTIAVDYDEVGTIRLDAFLADYLRAGRIVGHEQYVGRFTPHHFKQTVKSHGDLTGVCGDWAYVGQLDGGGNGSIRYDSPPELIITAYEKNGGITENYTLGADEGFMKLTVGDVEIVSGNIRDNAMLNKDGTDNVTLLASLNTATLSIEESEAGVPDNGVMLFTFSDLDHYVYDKVALNEVTAFDAQIPLDITNVEDSDGVSQDDEIDEEANLADVLLENINIRFGRTYLHNSYGPETSDLPQPFEVQFLNTSNEYQINTDDNCSVITKTATNWRFFVDEETQNPIDPDNVSITETSNSGLMNEGEFSGVLLRNDTQGSVNVEYQVPVWLMYDWDADGNHDNHPQAIATFGRFRGNDRIIIWREIGQ